MINDNITKNPTDKKKNIETPHDVYNKRVVILLLLLFWSGGERLGDWCKNANGQDHYTQCGSAAPRGTPTLVGWRH